MTVHRFLGGGGWVRLWRNGPGVSWIQASRPLPFSMRYGHKRYVKAFGWRITYLGKAHE